MLSLGEYLRKQGWSEEHMQVADVLLSQTCCAPIDKLSVADLKREMNADKAGTNLSLLPYISGLKEYRIKEGYSCLLDHIRNSISEIPILFNTQAYKVEYTPQGVNVYTEKH